MPAVATPVAPPLTLQGVAVPAGVINVNQFMAATRRHAQKEGSAVYNGQASDTFQLLKSDILAGIMLRFVGSVVVTPGTGTVATTARWPYDFFKLVQFTANGATNIISCSGAKLKVRDFQKRADLNDRGVAQTIAGTTRTQGTLSTASESWGVGQSTTAIAGGTYNIDISVWVPVAEDEHDLAGAIFLATSTADLTLQVFYESIANLFTITGNATVALTGTTSVTPVKYSIPIIGGAIVVPNLNLFHSMQQSRTTELAQGENETRVVGQGAGKSLLRLTGQVWSNNAPLQVNDTNFGALGWRFGTSETPDSWPAGVLRGMNERMYNTDIGAIQGFFCHEFASENSFRDVVDEGTAAELRLVTNLAAAPTNPALEYVSETVYMAGMAA